MFDTEVLNAAVLGVFNVVDLGISNATALKIFNDAFLGVFNAAVLSVFETIIYCSDGFVSIQGVVVDHPTCLGPNNSNIFLWSRQFFLVIPA